MFRLLLEPGRCLSNGVPLPPFRDVRKTTLFQRSDNKHFIRDSLSVTQR